MGMSRKDYQAVADTVREYRASVEHEAAYADVVDAVAARLADVFEKDNPYFDRTRFLNAATGSR